MLAHRVASALIARGGTAPSWDLVLDAAGPGWARVRMKLRPDMLNRHGTAHGGTIFALADSAFAYAGNSANQAAVAAQASIIFSNLRRSAKSSSPKHAKSAPQGAAALTRYPFTPRMDARSLNFKGSPGLSAARP